MHDDGACLMMAQVEKAPIVIKANVPKAEAEAMKKQIEAGILWCSVTSLVCARMLEGIGVCRLH